jgi:hypothetical protein
MLTVKCIRAIGQEPKVVANTAVAVIEDEYGNPIVVTVYVQPGVYTVVTPDDEDFVRILQGLGIDKIVVNNRLILNNDMKAQGQKLISGPGSLFS